MAVDSNESGEKSDVPQCAASLVASGGERQPKPPWIRVSQPWGESYDRLKKLMRSKALNTVCEHALCPNLAECWGRGAATFMILGDACTRNCAFCAVKKASPGIALPPPDSREAERLIEAASAMQLRHVVITSVTRDDLPDGGASLFAACIRLLREQRPACTVEVLIPDFQGNWNALEAVLDAGPDVLGHNVETVPRLYGRVRHQAQYERSLELLRTARKIRPNVLTKSGVMAGLGENWDDLLETFDDLRAVECDILTIGQYLRPGKQSLPVRRYYTPDEFCALRKVALEKEFAWVESGPFVRSSYHAEAQARELRRR